MTAAEIAHLRIKLDDIEPGVVRRIEVPLAIRLDRLHLLLQAAMGWTNSYLYEFRARDIGWAFQTRTSATAHSTPARPASRILSRTPVSGVSNTSATSAMAGNTGPHRVDR